MTWAAGRCTPNTPRPVQPCPPMACRHASAAHSLPRTQWLQYIGGGDWWAQHIPFERYIAAMLDDPYAYVGSVGFDILTHLLRGEYWMPVNLPLSPQAAPTMPLSLYFVGQSPYWPSRVPEAVRRRILSRVPLDTLQAVCTAALLSDAIAEDDVEQQRWMEAVEKVARKATPPGESPFTLHSTVYPQLARAWPTYSGRLTAVFRSSSGVDRFACAWDDAREREFSARNVDAGEFRTAGYKLPEEVLGVMVSPPPAPPGVGRALRDAAEKIAGKRSHAAFSGSFPSYNSSLQQIQAFEEEWTEKDGIDTLAFPIPYEPPPLDYAFFRVQDDEEAGLGSMVAVLAPSLAARPVLSVRPIADAITKKTRFYAEDAPIGEDTCVQCAIRRRGTETERRRCFAPRTSASTTEVPAVGVLFRCPEVMARLLADVSQTLRSSMRPTQSKAVAYAMSVLQTLRSHSKHSVAQLCRAARWIADSTALRSTLRDWHGVDTSAAWPTDLMSSLQHLRLNSYASIVNLMDPNATRLHSQDAVCPLSFVFAETMLESREGTEVSWKAICT